MDIVKHKTQGWFGFMFWREDDGTYLVSKENQDRSSIDWCFEGKHLEKVKIESIALAKPMIEVGFQYWCKDRGKMTQMEVIKAQPCVNTTLYEITPIGESRDYRHVIEWEVWESEIFATVESGPLMFGEMGHLLGFYKAQVEQYQKSMKEMEAVFKEMERRYNRFDYDVARIVEREMGHVKGWVERKIQEEKECAARAHKEWMESEERYFRIQAQLKEQEASIESAHHQAEISRGNRPPDRQPRTYLARRTEMMNIGAGRLGW